VAEDDKPLQYRLDYTLVTDDTGTKDDHLSHQFHVGADYNLGAFGAVGAMAWLEWCNTPAMGGDENGRELHRGDYGAYWLYPIEPIRTMFQAGWLAQTFPQYSGDTACTNEWYVALNVDDAKWFGTDEPVLSPYAAYYMDLDDLRGSWMEFGISHSFRLGPLGFEKTPVLKDMAITPSFIVGVDHRQLTQSTRVATLQYGLQVDYDLSEAMKIPPKYGRLGLAGFLYFRDALPGVEDYLRDRLYGGIRLAYSN